MLSVIRFLNRPNKLLPIPNPKEKYVEPFFRYVVGGIHGRENARGKIEQPEVVGFV